MFAERLERVRVAMGERGVDVLLLSAGADLPWLCGYEAMPLERLTLLVVPREGDAHLLVPHLEAPRVVERPDVFDLVTWRDGEDPIRPGMRGSAIFMHDDPADRPAERFGGRVTVHTGGDMASRLLLPIISAEPT